MTNAAAQDTATEAPMDPNTIVSVTIKDRLNAGKEPGSRWGRIKFDSDGVAEVKVPLKDVVKLHELRWLSVEDQEKYLGISQEAAAVITATTSEVAELQSQLDATKNANTRLASKNAELEAKLDEILAKYQKEYAAYQKDVDEKMQAFRADLDKAMSDLDAAKAANEALAKENASLKEAATQPIPTVKEDVAETKSGKKGK